ncbi:hypothetical protein G7K_0374-t1 [Saitoella complicata NRRL Y-17804]|uniref:3'-5' exoribonuclease Rv2179c-like domain-containing protein n=2 Tax=Saitoella complicata (strain BCRC 22490 / CBS 7301 / JCM 7358 / NBRC 10748 / NRRL Y-17804) TaxID=698492 RepID=A0A0E9N9P9_SAICN|nr:hypothetical protein G7K_0374-t1 [Saitoella complicata NRRL Y-17804]
MSTADGAASSTSASRKYPRIDIMLDLETLGTNPSPVLTQIAAVHFDLQTGETFSTFSCLVSPQSCMKTGMMKCDGSAMDFWLQQPSGVLENVLIRALKEGRPIKDVLGDFTAWIDGIKAESRSRFVSVWGNGIPADNVWIDSAYKACSMTKPWSVFGDRDVRTLVDLGQSMTDTNLKTETVFEGEKHNALADAIHQVKYCSAIYRAVSGLDTRAKEEVRKRFEEAALMSVNNTAAISLGDDFTVDLEAKTLIEKGKDLQNTPEAVVESPNAAAVETDNAEGAVAGKPSSFETWSEKAKVTLTEKEEESEEKLPVSKFLKKLSEMKVAMQTAGEKK